jgi:tRNA (guanine-N7-)-methyltransferase
MIDTDDGMSIEGEPVEVGLSDREAFSPVELIPDDFFQRLEPGDLFEGLEGPLEIDLGAGDGGFLMAMAREYPQRRFIGIERLLGRVRKMCRDAGKLDLNNVRLMRLETTYATEWLLPRACASRVHLLCPDPWPKKKHHKRRLMAQPEFLRSVHALLADGGELLFKTDHPGYFEHVAEVMEEIDFFEPCEWLEDAFFYPQTDFEKQWLADGRTIQRLRLRKL